MHYFCKIIESYRELANSPGCGSTSLSTADECNNAMNSLWADNEDFRKRNEGSGNGDDYDKAGTVTLVDARAYPPGCSYKLRDAIQAPQDVRYFNADEVGSIDDPDYLSICKGINLL